MMRRFVVSAAAVALVTGGLVVGGVTTASAGKPTVTATGSVSCGAPGSGKAKIKPPIKLAAQPGTRTTTSKFKVTCTGTTGNALVTPISAKITSTSTTAAVSCVDLQAAGETPLQSVLDIKWKASGGKINPTHIVFTSTLNGTPASGATFPGPTGTSIVTGSYAGNDALSTVVNIDPVQTLIDACLGKGIKKLNFGPNNLSLTP
jgi:hypothetical protein